MVRQRADQLLVARGLADSRSRAQALIMAGAVQVEGCSFADSDASLRLRMTTDRDGPSCFLC